MYVFHKGTSLERKALRKRKLVCSEVSSSILLPRHHTLNAGPIPVWVFSLFLISPSISFQDNFFLLNVGKGGWWCPRRMSRSETHTADKQGGQRVQKRQMADLAQECHGMTTAHTRVPNWQLGCLHTELASELHHVTGCRTWGQQSQECSLSKTRKQRKHVKKNASVMFLMAACF